MAYVLQQAITQVLFAAVRIATTETRVNRIHAHRVHAKTAVSALLCRALIIHVHVRIQISMETTARIV